MQSNKWGLSIDLIPAELWHASHGSLCHPMGWSSPQSTAWFFPAALAWNPWNHGCHGSYRPLIHGYFQQTLIGLVRSWTRRLIQFDVRFLQLLVQNSDVSSTSIFSHFQALKAVCLSNKTKDGVSDGFPVSPTQKKRTPAPGFSDPHGTPCLQRHVAQRSWLR